MNVVGPMGEALDVEGPWYALVRDMVEGDFHASAWRLLSNQETEQDAREAALWYVDAVPHKVQWQVGEVVGTRPGGVIVLGLSNGATSDVRICEDCAMVIGQGRSWKQVIGQDRCAACDADLI